MQSVRIKAKLWSRVATWLALLFLLLSVLQLVATDRAYFERRLRFEAAFPPLELSQEDRQAIVQSLALAMNGNTGSLELLEISPGGQQQKAFNELEIAHMQDVAGLMRLAKHVIWAIGILLIALIFAGNRKNSDESKARARASAAKGSLLGVADIVALLAIAGIWAAVDFRSIFWLFHQVAFTNDLWLLNPETDLLIRLLPQTFFEQIALRILLFWAVAVAFVFIVSLWGYIRNARKLRKGEA